MKLYILIVACLMMLSSGANATRARDKTTWLAALINLIMSLWGFILLYKGV